ncbi:cupin domain-containing protein [Solimonas soli]|uniref:cupin domain-containing protein n=1 Tax=Solimonas soli TaxID=413479 RepID=UPI0004BC6931|nr:cupin domain-containing protein [Solimonas soli]
MTGAGPQPAVRRGDAQAERLTAERCYITELSNHDGDEAVSIARARVAPGVTTRWHRLRDIAERYVIVSGHGTVEVEGLPALRVARDDVVLIPAGHRQRIRNDGEQDLIFLAICTPRFRWDAYEDVDPAS